MHELFEKSRDIEISQNFGEIINRLAMVVDFLLILLYDDPFNYVLNKDDICFVSQFQSLFHIRLVQKCGH